MDQSLEERFARIESKLALTEDTVDVLNMTVFRQQKQIERLQMQLAEMHRQPGSKKPRCSFSPMRTRLISSNRLLWPGKRWKCCSTSGGILSIRCDLKRAYRCSDCGCSA